MLTLVLGGARSGKSSYAQQRALNSNKQVTYLATATALDDEMRLRIQQHRSDRPAHWHTHEEALQLSHALQQLAHEEQCIIVDCLTLWLSNLLLQEDLQPETETQQLLKCLPELRGDIILVSNETGLGIIPLGAINRRFVDESGKLHQQLAQICDQVIFMTAGLAQVLK